MSRRTGVVAGLGAVIAGAAVAARQIDRKWAAAHDPIEPHQRLLPAGDGLMVATDDGAKLAVTVAGPADGPDVVLAHCWTGRREVWAPVAHRLVERGHRVVLYDQRGHGSSTVGDDGFTIPRLGADLRAVIEEVDARDAVLAGHSMGGMTIQSLAAHHPDVVAARARALVLVATAASGISQGRRDAPAARIIGGRGLEQVMRSPIGHALVRGSVGRSVRRHHLVTTRDLFVATPPDARSGWLTAMQTMDLREGIAGIGVPTTVVVGTHDRLTPPERAAELAQTIPGARLVTLDDAGHMLPLEEPDRIAELIAAA